MIGPTGERLSNGSGDGTDLSTIILDEPGEYQLLVLGNGANTGDYSFRYVTPTITTTPLLFDTDVNATITEPGEVDRYTFTGTVGQRLFFNSLANSSLLERSPELRTERPLSANQVAGARKSALISFMSCLSCAARKVRVV